jgi:hypothetical protein
MEITLASVYLGIKKNEEFGNRLCRQTNHFRKKIKNILWKNRIT